jgi:hypothetical protein
VTLRTKRLLERKRGILLDVSLGGEKQPRSVALRRGGDISHSPLTLPFPLPDACVHTAVITHVLEYLDPDRFFPWWNELWRIMQPAGIVYISGPYGGDESHGWLSDPLHRTRIVEQTFAWLDPRTPIYALHDSIGRPRPKPWYPLTISRVPGTHGTFGYNSTLRKPSRQEMR